MSCTYFFVPFLYLLFSHHLCTPFVFYTTGPCRAFFTRHRNQFGESSFVCGLCVLVNVVHICDCVCGFFSLNTDKKTFVYINWQIKMKTHQWNFDSVNTSHSQRGGRWKYLVLDLGVFERPVAVKGCTAPALMGSKGTFVSIKEQKSTGMHKRKEKRSFTVKAYSTARKGQRGLSNYKKCKLEFS